MNSDCAPIAFSQKYLLNQLVVIVKEYSLYGLSKIRYSDDCEEFIIDSKSLTDEPSREHTINIRLLGGVPHDSGFHQR